MTRTITLVGARGGQGATTVATALAVLTAGHKPTTLMSADCSATAALLGVPFPPEHDWAQVTPTLRLNPIGADRPPAGAHDVVIVDAGRCPSNADVKPYDPVCGPVSSLDGESYAVLRGPCYVALATLVTTPAPSFDGVVLVAEPGRSLSALDVTDVLGIPVVATIPATPFVARTIDAGLLLTRLSHLREFRPLRALADPALTPKSALSKTHTALHLSRSDRCGATIRDGHARYRSIEPRGRRLLHR